MTTTHHCTDRCSHRVSDAQLEGWGFTLRKTDKVCGMTVLVQAGLERNVAMHAAWVAGHVRLCTRTEALAS